MADTPDKRIGVPVLLRRSPWPQSAAEIVCDIALWVVVLKLAFIAGAGYGLWRLPLMDVMFSPQKLEQQKLFSALLAVVAAMEYPAMLLVIASLRFRPESTAAELRRPLILRIAFSLACWMYLLVLYFLLRG
jgi:hypothetical protein